MTTACGYFFEVGRPAYVLVLVYLLGLIYCVQRRSSSSIKEGNGILQTRSVLGPLT